MSEAVWTSPLTAIPLRQGLSDYLELTKPRLSLLVLATTAVGFWLGVRRVEELARVTPLLIGTAFVVGGANALNQWLERVPDGLMKRTQHRPLPAGRLAPEAAFRFGVALSAGGIACLALAVNERCAMLAAASWASYVFLYTPMKRWTACCTLLGAVPGALPPVIGWVGARNAGGAQAWALFAILFVWQLPHFLSLALLYRDDYERAGFRLLPLIESDGRITARQIALYGLALVPVSLVPTLLGVAGPTYFYGALALGVVFSVIALRTSWQRSAKSARQLFHASILYLPALLGLLAFDRAPF